MSTYPQNRMGEFVEWCLAHETVFLDNAEGIGLTEGQAKDFASLAGKAASALAARESAMLAARVAARQARQAVRNLRAGAGNVVRLVRARAESGKNPQSIYGLAQISPPAAPSPAPAPATPQGLSAELDANDGALTLRWKARQPAGTSGASYIVRRRLPGEADFRMIGAAGVKLFRDDTLPAGVESVWYTVQSVRGRRMSGMSPLLSVRMGTVARHAAEGAVTAAPAAGRPSANFGKSAKVPTPGVR